jgi:hypothetical protein
MSSPKVTPAEVERLIEALRVAPARWLSAADLSATLWGHCSEGTKRRVRALASAAGAGVVGYPGSPGYALWSRCTVDELHACVSAYTDQTDEMRRRRDQYRCRLHREHPARIVDRPAEIEPSSRQLALL